MSDYTMLATESDALKKAQTMAGRLLGTVAVKVVAHGETGELESVTILGQFSEVPEDLAESLRGV